MPHLFIDASWGQHHAPDPIFMLPKASFDILPTRNQNFIIFDADPIKTMDMTTLPETYQKGVFSLIADTDRGFFKW